MLGSPSYGLVRTLDCTFDEALPRVRKALGDNGFGVLTEIDMKATMKAKLDKELRPYLILGACHPPTAWEALGAAPAIGLLLPCNVVLTVDDSGKAVVGAVDPDAMFKLVDAEGIEAAATDVKNRLQAALDAI